MLFSSCFVVFVVVVIIAMILFSIIICMTIARVRHFVFGAEFNINILSHIDLYVYHFEFNKSNSEFQLDLHYIAP